MPTHMSVHMFRHVRICLRTRVCGYGRVFLQTHIPSYTHRAHIMYARHVRANACNHVHMHVYTLVNAHVCLYVHAHVYTHPYTHVCTSTHVCTLLCTHVYPHACTYVSVHMSIHISIHMSIHISIRMFITCSYKCLCICLNSFVYTSPCAQVYTQGRAGKLPCACTWLLPHRPRTRVIPSCGSLFFWTGMCVDMCADMCANMCTGIGTTM